ncbi:hypothetical protein GMOD_00008345 [Pyrenophora seminiperda CCB06]|uniref:Uncharacterized protein n=1 Tax=Pyrenophora seminiperda CCB06 TaxID=1302712 RepID=A0A3M7M2I0_9PLEO|nr:hypothetical protein GMOD_00008345 [Pyrenophora seminiperda CCB06]
MLCRKTVKGLGEWQSLLQVGGGKMKPSWSRVGVEWRRDDAYIWRRLRRVGKQRENSIHRRGHGPSDASCNVRMSGRTATVFISNVLPGCRSIQATVPVLPLRQVPSQRPTTLTLPRGIISDD